ncbi:MAG: pyridoxamine 5'-phosphate oxidase family protein [Thalassovita sp.]
MTDFIENIEALEALYGTPSTPALRKVVTRLTPLYRKWIETSRYCVLSTVGPDGTDGSPRGNNGPVVVIADEQTLLMPDWRGNNRLDSLRNIVLDGRVSLMFMVPGSSTVVRVNGQAKVSADPELCGRFEQAGKAPVTVIIIRIGEIYAQCAKATIRSGLWSRDDSEAMPTFGQILSEIVEDDDDGKAFDAALAERLPKTLW